MSQYEQYPEENYTLSYNNLASTNRSRKSSVRLLNSNQNQDNEFDSWIQRQSSTTNKENIMTQQKKTLFPSVTKGQERQIGKAIKGAGMTMNEIAKNKPVGGLMAPKAKTYGQTSTNSNFTDSRYSEEEENHTTTLDYNKTHNQVNSKQTGKTFVGIAPVKHEVNIQKEHKRSNYQLPNDEYGTEDFTQEQQEEELRHVEARPTTFYE